MLIPFASCVPWIHLIFSCIHLRLRDAAALPGYDAAAPRPPNVAPLPSCASHPNIAAARNIADQNSECCNTTSWATALDTLCGQAFGARQYHLLGVYKQRAMLVIGLTCVPFSLLWANAGRILAFIGQDPAVAAEAGTYARWLIPSIFVNVPLQCHIRFLQTQSLVLPVAASSGFTALCHEAVCWALVYRAGMGIKGAALSNAISYAVNLIMLALYVRLSSACERTWNGFSMEGLKELRPFAALAVPSALMICLEFWAFEIVVLVSGLLPNPQLETSVLSICTRVSNELGAGQHQAAKLAMKVVMCMALSSGFVLTLAMTLLRHVWGHMYSNDHEVVSYYAKMLPVLGISFFVDGLHASLSGVLTGCGKQKIGAAINLGAFYLAGIPMAVLLGFVFHMVWTSFSQHLSSNLAHQHL
ncbi:hypothetical protein PR202_ga20346 [Eleusine coracana subsp. coracana]|uniref:Protein DETOXIFICATION n=1 Tax=Eleusine coracana subsp. coracana TaxID=191504 RepID=A0AAV5CYT0_ELECO|nr:hypothetical protein QOZ80_4AG0317630 [Eleusine coracana subsp. coracana]GJN02950.1 hypothetical protein PR202_ga20346 [Eleusine coracana subsp. coracana]